MTQYHDYKVYSEKDDWEYNDEMQKLFEDRLAKAPLSERPSDSEAPVNSFYFATDVNVFYRNDLNNGWVISGFGVENNRIDKIFADEVDFLSGVVNSAPSGSNDIARKNEIDQLNDDKADDPHGDNAHTENYATSSELDQLDDDKADDPHGDNAHIENYLKEGSSYQTDDTDISSPDHNIIDANLSQGESVEVDKIYAYVKSYSIWSDAGFIDYTLYSPYGNVVGSTEADDTVSETFNEAIFVTSIEADTGDTSFSGDRVVDWDLSYAAVRKHGHDFEI